MHWDLLSELWATDHEAARPPTYLHTGSKVVQDGQLALEESKMGSYFPFFVVQDEYAFQKHLSRTTKAAWLSSG